MATAPFLQIFFFPPLMGSAAILFQAKSILPALYGKSKKKR